MRRGIKFIILVSAFLITFVGFSMIASPYINAIKIGREAGFHMISNHLAMKEKAKKVHPIYKRSRNLDCIESVSSEKEGC
jgi:hypothetical protein